MSELRNIILKVMRDNLVSGQVAVVKSVDKTKNTCEVLLDAEDIRLPAVRLQSVVATVNNPVIFYPEVDSYVAVAPLFNSRQHWFVVAMSQVEEIVLRGSDLGGLVVAEKVAERLERVEEAVEALRDDFNAHTHETTCAAGVGSTVVPAPPSAVALVPKTTEEYISNDKVKHG